MFQGISSSSHNIYSQGDEAGQRSRAEKRLNTPKPTQLHDSTVGTLTSGPLAYRF